MKRYIMFFGVLASLSSSGLNMASARPGDDIERNRIQGAIRFVGCAPDKSQVVIRILPGTQSVRPSASVRRSDGSTMMTFSKIMAGEPQSVRLKLVVPPACAGATVTPAEKIVDRYPASVAFSVQTPLTTHRIDLPNAVNLLDLVLNTLEVKLHNYQSNNSFIKIADLLTSYLSSRGVTGRIMYYGINGGYLEIFTR